MSYIADNKKQTVAGKKKVEGVGEKKKKDIFMIAEGENAFLNSVESLEIVSTRSQSVSHSIKLIIFFSFYFFLFFSYNSTISLLETSREIDEFFWKIFHETSSPENIYTVESAMGVV